MANHLNIIAYNFYTVLNSSDTQFLFERYQNNLTFNLKSKQIVLPKKKTRATLNVAAYARYCFHLESAVWFKKQHKITLVAVLVFIK